MQSIILTFCGKNSCFSRQALPETAEKQTGRSTRNKNVYPCRRCITPYIIRLWRLSYITRRIPVCRRSHTKASGLSTLTVGGLSICQRRCQQSLGVLGGGRVSFAHDDETGDWYICHTTDEDGFIVWKDKGVRDSSLGLSCTGSRSR